MMANAAKAQRPCCRRNRRKIEEAERQLADLKLTDRRIQASIRDLKEEEEKLSRARGLDVKTVPQPRANRQAESSDSRGVQSTAMNPYAGRNAGTELAYPRHAEASNGSKVNGGRGPAALNNNREESDSDSDGGYVNPLEIDDGSDVDEPNSLNAMSEKEKKRELFLSFNKKFTHKTAKEIDNLVILPSAGAKRRPEIRLASSSEEDN